MSLILLLYCEPILSCFCVNLDPVFFFACPPPGAECKKTNEYLSFGALIYSWYTTMYVDFIEFCPKQYCEFADHCFVVSPTVALGGGNPSRHVPKPRTIISMKCLDASVLHVMPIRITRLLRLTAWNICLLFLLATSNLTYALVSLTVIRNTAPLQKHE